ncbi:MAG TPA: hypothetical protein VJ123_01045 [Anaerolineales bacterium]|nr:hypothetical protein [Anaerolineales bacterium]
MTTVPRTIADVTAAGIAEEVVRQAVLEALGRGLTNRQSLEIDASRRGRRVEQVIRTILQQVEE